MDNTKNELVREDGSVIRFIPAGPNSFLLTLDGKPFNIGERLTQIADERPSDDKAG